MVVSKLNQEMAVLSEGIKAEFRKRQYESLKKTRYGLLHVTDLTKPCVRHTYYDKLKIHTQAATYDTTLLSYFFGGEGIHQLLDKASAEGEGETPLYYNFVDDTPVTLFGKDGELTAEVKKWGVAEWLKILIGESDAIYKVGDQEMLVDYKTIKSKGFKKKAASDDHVLQMSIYAYLMKKIMKKDITHGAVIYLDYDDRFGKPLIFSMPLASADVIHEMLLKKYEMIKSATETGVLPPREQTWLCDGYCKYASRCFTEDTISKKENQLDVVLK